MSAIIATYRAGSMSRNSTTVINARLSIVCNIIQNTPSRFFLERREGPSAFLFIRSALGAVLRFFDIGLIPFIYSMYTEQMGNFHLTSIAVEHMLPHPYPLYMSLRTTVLLTGGLLR